jgi:hypothetical protein
MRQKLRLVLGDLDELVFVTIEGLPQRRGSALRSLWFEDVAESDRAFTWYSADDQLRERVQKLDLYQTNGRGAATGFHRRNEVLDRILHFLNGPHLNLAHALAA